MSSQRCNPTGHQPLPCEHLEREAWQILRGILSQNGTPLRGLCDTCGAVNHLTLKEGGGGSIFGPANDAGRLLFLLVVLGTQQPSIKFNGRPPNPGPGFETQTWTSQQSSYSPKTSPFLRIFFCFVLLLPPGALFLPFFPFSYSFQ